MKTENKPKAYTLFDFSQTCKNALIEFGFDCENYDILKDGTDLFASDLNFIEPGSFVFSFFPCDFFNEKSSMRIKGDSYLLKSILNKYGSKENYMKYNVECRMRNLTILQNHINILKDKKCKVIIENPRNQTDRFLEHFFAENGFSKLYVKNRSWFGDNFIKPTNFFYCNLKLSNELVMFKTHGKIFRVMETSKSRNSIYKVCKKKKVSNITKEFFMNFLKNFEI